MNFKVTLVYESSKHLVLLPKEIQYLELLRYVGKKFDISDNSVISLYYKVQKLSRLALKVSLVSPRHDFDLNVSLLPVEPDNQFNVLPQWQRLSFANMPITPPPPEPNIKIPQGKNLVAARMDGNNQILPIAMGVIQGETGASWTWFMTDASDDELTPWAAAKVKDKMLKSLNWKVNDIDSLKVYQVFDNKSIQQVDCINFICTCRKWQLPGLPCGHVCVVSRVCGLTNCNLWAQPWFMNTTLKDTYRELVYPLKDVSMWEAPNDLQQVLPSVMVKQPARRPKNTNHILSKGEAPSLDR
ncbi:transposase, MuDR, MULE transposase domain protein [Tanacetum coccineum]|uniref:Transposase, MuDR, MULE transposase domain protein n=1 Tax=Tanacetum coccineum TaxID=301880 RepID=A0ABQ5APR2_9ASTR